MFINVWNRFFTSVHSLLFLIFFLGILVPLFAEETSKAVSSPETKQEGGEVGNKTSIPLEDREDNKTRMDVFNQVYEHRLMFRGGWGIGKLSPAILNETGPAWFQNSLFRQITEPGAPLSIPYKPAKELGVNSQFWDIRVRL